MNLLKSLIATRRRMLISAAVLIVLMSTAVFFTKRPDTDDSPADRGSETKRPDAANNITTDIQENEQAQSSSKTQTSASSTNVSAKAPAKTATAASTKSQTPQTVKKTNPPAPKTTGSNTNEENDEDSDDGTTKTLPGKPVVEVPVDKVLTIGGVSWKILDVGKVDSISDGKTTDKANGKYVIIQVEARLTDDSKVVIDPEWIFLMDSEMVYYNHNLLTETLLENQQKDLIAHAELTKSKAVSGYIVFDVPKETVNSKLKLILFDMDPGVYDYGSIII